MRLAATNLSLPFNADESALMMLLASELRVKQEDIQSLRITRPVSYTHLTLPTIA